MYMQIHIYIYIYMYLYIYSKSDRLIENQNTGLLSASAPLSTKVVVVEEETMTHYTGIR